MKARQNAELELADTQLQVYVLAIAPECCSVHVIPEHFWSEFGEQSFFKMCNVYCSFIAKCKN